MKTFIELITEQKNTHMEHVEDEIFNGGVSGTRKAINFLRDLRDMLAGNTSNKISATVKWDGAPAIFAGIDPTDGKFFVAKKGVFNKNPKVYKSNVDIDNDVTGDLADKLKIALRELSKVGIKSGVYQGDMMFTKGDVKTETIDGQKYSVFHPNTIAYAVPYSSELGKRIRSAQLGVVWHTSYSGDSFETMKASFGNPIVSNMKQTPSVWMDDATYKDYSGTATFTFAETQLLTNILSEAGKVFQSMPPAVLNDVMNDEQLKTLIKTFNNSKIRSGDRITNTDLHTSQLYSFIHDKLQAEIDKRTTAKGKSTQEESRKKILSYFTKHDKKDIVKMFDLMNLLTAAKQMINDKMQQAGHVQTFLKTKNGFRVTGVEGFVAIDHLTGNAVKIVDRMEFSYANFSADIVKGWQR